MSNNDNSGLRLDGDFTEETAFGSSRTPEMDPADYLPDMEEFDLTEAQKTELLETLWQIMGSFARMGFVIDVCGLLLEDFNEAAASDSPNGTIVTSNSSETPSKDDGKEGIA